MTQNVPVRFKINQNNQKGELKWHKTTQNYPKGDVNWPKLIQNKPKQRKIFVFSRNKLSQIAKLEEVLAKSAKL